MNPNRWLSLVARRMLRSGLPIEYVQRSIGELSAHLMDVGQHEPAAIRRLGSPKVLAAQFETAYRRSKWYRRLPTLAWLLLPVPLCIASCMAWYVAGFIALDICFGIFPAGEVSSTAVSVTSWFFYSAKFIAPALAAYILFKAVRASGKPRWIRTACVVILSVMFLVTMTEMRFPTATEQGALMIVIESEEVAPNVLWQLGQAATVLLLAAWDSIRPRLQMPQQLSIE